MAILTTTPVSRYRARSRAASARDARETGSVKAEGRLPTGQDGVSSSPSPSAFTLPVSRASLADAALERARYRETGVVVRIAMLLLKCFRGCHPVTVRGARLSDAASQEVLTSVLESFGIAVREAYATVVADAALGDEFDVRVGGFSEAEFSSLSDEYVEPCAAVFVRHVGAYPPPPGAGPSRPWASTRAPSPPPRAASPRTACSSPHRSGVGAP